MRVTPVLRRSVPAGPATPTAPRALPAADGLARSCEPIQRRSAARAPLPAPPAPTRRVSSPEPSRGLPELPEEPSEAADLLDDEVQELLAPMVRDGVVSHDLVLDFRLQLAGGDCARFFGDLRRSLRAALTRTPSRASEIAALQERLSDLEERSATLGRRSRTLRARGVAWARASSPVNTREGRALTERLTRAGLCVPSSERNLVFSALRLGPRRVEDEAALAQVIDRAARERGTGSLAEALLVAAGYEHAGRIVALHRDTGVAFLGYDAAQLEAFAELWLRSPYAGLLNNRGRPRHRWLHDVQLVQPSANPSRYKYSAVNKAVIMPPIRDASDLRVFLHEVAHGVEHVRIMTEDGPTPMGRRWESASWRRDGTPKGTNFIDSDGDGRVVTRDAHRPDEPLRDYSTLNMSEDFAEALSFFLVASAHERRALRRRLGPAKSRILDALLREAGVD